MLTMTELCALGVDVLAEKAKAGEIGPWNLWTAIKGAKKYRDAIASGDVVDRDVDKEIRHMRCLLCPSLTREPTSLPDVSAWFCGPAFEERPQTCGCLVSVTIKGHNSQDPTDYHGYGVPWPSGKVYVKSETCPQGKW